MTIRINKEIIGGNIRIDDDVKDINEKEDIKHVCCNGEECKLPDWAAEDQ